MTIENNNKSPTSTLVTVKDPAKTEKLPMGIKNKSHWRIVRICSWFWLLTCITCAPVMMSFSYLDLQTKTQLKDRYVGPTVLTLHFTTSIIIGATLSFFLYGKTGLMNCFNPRAILMQSPVSVGYVCSEALALFAMRTASPIMYAVIHKIRLLETAIMTRIFLKRKISLLSWLICFTVTSSVLGFVLFDVHQKQTDKKESEFFGVLLLFFNITISVACSIYGDWVYKKLNYSLPIQMAQGRVSAALGAFILSCIFLTAKKWWKYGFFGGPGPKDGWNYQVVCLYLFMIVRDWSTCFVLLHLDALWKALAGSAAVGTTYIVDVIMHGKQVIPGKVCLLFAIMFGVSIYAIAKVVEKKNLDIHKREEDLLLKIRKLEGEKGLPDSSMTTMS